MKKPKVVSAPSELRAPRERTQRYPKWLKTNLAHELAPLDELDGYYIIYKHSKQEGGDEAR